MNADLFRSVHLVVGSVLALGLGSWAIVDLGGDVLGGESTRLFRLVSGFVALASMLAVAAYGLRKYAHRGGYSPEFLMRTDYEAIAGATRELQRIEAENAGAGTDRLAALRKEVKAVVRRAGAHRVLRGVVEIDDDGRLEVRIVPTEPLGRVAGWMGVHIGYGITFAVAVLAHGGLASRSGLGVALLLVSICVVVSGVLGAFLWSAGPRWITAAEKDLSVEEAFALSESLARKLRRAQEDGDGVTAPHDIAVLTQQERNVKRELAVLQRVRWRIMGWKLVHVPGVILLLALVAVHVAVIWRY